MIERGAGGYYVIMRVLVTGWPSFLHGEATAGDVLSMRRVRSALEGAGIECESAWSPVFTPGALTIEEADPERYTHLVFACGPAYGPQLRWLHERFAACRRIAVGVSVVDRDDSAAAGFDDILARDNGGHSDLDLSASADSSTPAVTGLVLAPQQHEYGQRRRHDPVHDRLVHWVAGLDCATVELDTRLDTNSWRHCSTPDQFLALISRMDVVVTTRLHGLALALRMGVPALAIDPLACGGKVTAQARAWHWPALVSAERAIGPDADAAFDAWWRWCLTDEATSAAKDRAAHSAEALTARLLETLTEDDDLRASTERSEGGAQREGVET